MNLKSILMRCACARVRVCRVGGRGGGGDGGEGYKRIHYSARPMPTPDGLISWSLLRATFFWTIRLETETGASGFDTSACVWLETHAAADAAAPKTDFFFLVFLRIIIILLYSIFYFIIFDWKEILTGSAVSGSIIFHVWCRCRGLRVYKRKLS